MAGFKVSTLVVVPGMAVCVEETDPFPARRPESGSGLPLCPNAAPWERRRNASAKSDATPQKHDNGGIVVTFTEWSLMAGLTWPTQDCHRTKAELRRRHAHRAGA